MRTAPPSPLPPEQLPKPARPWEEPPLAYVDDGQPVWCFIGNNRWRAGAVVVAAGDHARVKFAPREGAPAFRWVPIDALRARPEGAT